MSAAHHRHPLPSFTSTRVQTPNAEFPARLFDERLIRLSVVPRLLPHKPNGRPVGVSSVYRWALRGVRGVVLETTRAPFGRVTTVEAVERFLRRLNDGQLPQTDMTPVRRRRAIAAADKFVSFKLGLVHGSSDKGVGHEG